MIFEMCNKFPVYGQRCHCRIYRLHEHILILRSLNVIFRIIKIKLHVWNLGLGHRNIYFTIILYTPVFPEDRVINMLILSLF